MAVVKQCKVCMSKHKSIVEELATKKFSAEKIYEYLQGLTNPRDVKIVQEEQLKPSSIRRHLQRHFDAKSDELVHQASAKSKIKDSRKNYADGIKINIDKANTIAHLIEVALARMEEVEDLSDAKKHQYTIGYMGQLKGLVDELDKVSSELNESGGTIDAAFYSAEIDTFAKIVLATIRALDQQFNMNYNLEVAFSEEFKKQYTAFKQREQLIFNGELSPKDGEKERNVNTFNDDSCLV